MALWWLLPASVARVGLVGVPFSCGVGQTFGGVGRFGGFEAWQTAALNAYKRSHCCGRGVLLSHCCGLVVALRAGVAPVGLVGVPFRAELGGLLDGLERWRRGKRQP